MFDFNEATKRVRLGVIGIKRQLWTRTVSLAQDENMGDEFRIYYSDYKVFQNLTPADREAKDWYFPDDSDELKN